VRLVGESEEDLGVEIGGRSSVRVGGHGLSCKGGEGREKEGEREGGKESGMEVRRRRTKRG